MIIFLAAAIVIVVLTLTAFFWPLRSLRQQAPAESSAPLQSVEQQAEWQASWAALAAQRAEIDADVDADMLAADAREESVREWSARAGVTLAAIKAQPEASQAPLRRWSMVSAVVLVLAAIVLYAVLGNPRALEGNASPSPLAAVNETFDPESASAGQAAHAQSPAAVQEMLKSLEAKLAAQPDNVAGWALLARSKGQLGDFAGAAAAYEQALRLAPADPDLLTDAADVLAMAQGRNLQGRPSAMIAQALKIDPEHHKALALAASAAMQAGQRSEAIIFWKRLRATFADGSDDAAQIDQVLAQLSGSALGANTLAEQPAFAEPEQLPAPAAQALPKSNAAASAGISGAVDITPALRGRVAAHSTLFVYARNAASTSRMPLAVMRMPLPVLPASFLLDDSMAMAPAMNLSSADKVDIEARISVSGQATPQSGDLRGVLRAVKTGSSQLRILIDTVQP